ncbi:hypothetical protein WDW37_18755 [Bdellovibrionota bacterium FG-1]
MNENINVDHLDFRRPIENMLRAIARFVKSALEKLASRVCFGPIAAILTTILLAVLLLQLNLASNLIRTAKNTQVTPHRKITLIPMGDTTSETRTPQ